MCFNIGHWMFAYEYYVSAISMKYIFQQTTMPPAKLKCLENLNKCFFAANILIPLAYDFILCYTNYVSTYDSIKDPNSTFNPIHLPGW